MFKYLVLFSFLISVSYYLSCSFRIKQEQWKLIHFLGVFMPMILFSGALYALFERIREDNKLVEFEGYFWLFCCLFFIFYVLSVLLWLLTADNPSLEGQSTFCRELVVIGGCNILGVVLMALTMF